MKYNFENVNIEGAVKTTEKGVMTQSITTVGSLQKNDGTEIMKLTDSMDVELDKDKSITENEMLIQKSALEFVTNKYSDTE